MVIFGIALILVAFGVVMIYSASAIYADQRYGDSMYFLKRHLVSLVIGGAAMAGVMVIDYKSLRRWVTPILGVVGAGLVLVLVPGLTHQAGGAKRWFAILGFHIQPSEFAKIALALFLADRLADTARDPNDFKKTLLPLAAFTGVLVGLTLLQPDLGTSAVMSALFLTLLYISGLRLRFFAGLAAAVAAAFVLAVLVEPYRMRRVVSFLRPWEDVRGAGFQLWQSFLAIGSGGLTGVGLGQSRQKLFYLPAAHTDFIFSIIAEELGFVGAAAVILLFAGFVLYGMLVVVRCTNRFGQLLSLGIVSMIGLEAIINIGVSIGAFPTKGLALPFESYGGSAMIAKLMSVGLLLKI